MRPPRVSFCACLQAKTARQHAHGRRANRRRQRAAGVRAYRYVGKDIDSCLQKQSGRVSLSLSRDVSGTISRAARTRTSAVSLTHGGLARKKHETMLCLSPTRDETSARDRRGSDGGRGRERRRTPQNLSSRAQGLSLSLSRLSVRRQRLAGFSTTTGVRKRGWRLSAYEAARVCAISLSLSRLIYGTFAVPRATFANSRSCPRRQVSGD